MPKVSKKPMKKTVKKTVRKTVKKTVHPVVKKQGKPVKMLVKKTGFSRAHGHFLMERKKVSLLKGSSKTVNIKVKQLRTKDVILVLDFGSQYTQLIARRIRENKVFSRIVPYTISAQEIKAIGPKGIVFSGGPMSVYDPGAPHPDKAIFSLGIPILGVCYGMQVITQMLGGKVNKCKDREYGRSELFVDSNRDLFVNLPTNLTCWMSHGDEIMQFPAGFEKLAHTLNNNCAAMGSRSKKI
jgi:GMP synthase (glutamine-hydrolysing) A subunit